MLTGPRCAVGGVLARGFHWSRPLEPARSFLAICQHDAGVRHHRHAPAEQWLGNKSIRLLQVAVCRTGRRHQRHQPGIRGSITVFHEALQEGEPFTSAVWR